MAWRLLLILLVCSVGGASLHAQLPYRLSLAYDTELPDEKGLRDLLTIPQAFAQRGARTQAVKNLVNTLREAGFLAASLDSISGDTAFNMTAYLHVGRSYRWAQLERGNVEDQILNRTGFRDRLYYNRPLNVRQVNRLFRQIITYCENHGYPFASIRLDSVEFDGQAMRAVLQLTKNREFRIDSIQVKGDAKIGVKYLSNYLGIKAGSLYDQSRLDRISTRIKELPFATESQRYEVIFTPDKAKLGLFLKHRKANGINGVLGVLPDEETGRITLTGDVKLNLQNPLGKGETVDFNWRRLQTNTQDLKINVVIPFLLNTPFGVDLGFKLYRRDTLFTDLNRNVGVQYLLSGGNYFKAFVNWQTSSLVNTTELLDLTSVPPLLDVSITSYGIGIRSQRLDYRLNPRRGYQVVANGSVGNKTIKRNVDLNPEIYDSLDLTVIQYRLELEGSLFIPLRSRSTVRLGLQGGLLETESLFRNELYRIGGLKTLRGFDEESIFASIYSIATVEVRYLLEQNSYAYLFWDGAYVENNSQGSAFTDRPFGFGVGVSFETKAGIFSFSYALGKQRGNPILLRAAKLHFGFVTFI